MSAVLQIAKFEVKHQLCSLSNDRNHAALQYARMKPTDVDKRVGNNLRAWREFRRMKQEELADKVGTTGAVISLLESGGRKLSPKWLYRLAPALGTRPGHLMDYDPNELPTDMLDVWGDIDEVDRPRVLKAIEAFRRKAV